MKKSIKMLSIICLYLFFFSGISFSALTDVNLRFQGNTISADLRDVTLKDIFDNIQKEKGVWYSGDDTLLQNRISVRFKDLSILDGLKRIIGQLNHTILFDKNNNVEGVLIIGNAKIGAFQMNTSNPSASTPTHPSIPFDPSNFKIMHNVPPPGIRPDISGGPETFKPMKNVPPPGAPPSNVEISPFNLNHSKNVPPPNVGEPEISFAQPPEMPTENPFAQPPEMPTENPFGQPPEMPTENPFAQPQEMPTENPFAQPPGMPTENPFAQPPGMPTENPFAQPPEMPAENPFAQPQEMPTENPFAQPPEMPAENPFAQPQEMPVENQPPEMPAENPSVENQQ